MDGRYTQVEVWLEAHAFKLLLGVLIIKFI